VDDFIYQCGLAMVDVGDDGDISDCLHVAENGRKSTVFSDPIGFAFVKF
jgi:hypothetical protein